LRAAASSASSASATSSCCAVPIGLFFGRLANFVNGELWGRPTDVPWAMVFPSDPDHLPRHPSQLYQATLEGLVLFTVLFILNRHGARQKPGMVTGAFLAGYAIARTTGELFRQPDPQLGFLIFGVTMGQLLSLPMLLCGLWLIRRARKLPAPQAA
jgi:phosphatidylglycerol:prolipoprotein diacylglycerol transferase